MMSSLEDLINSGASNCLQATVGCSGNCQNNPAGSYYSESIIGSYRVIAANGIPYHNYEHDAMRPNPNGACEHRMALSLPLNPTRGKYTKSNMGPVGISVSGGFIFNDLSRPTGELAVPNEGPSLDSCKGHSEQSCRLIINFATLTLLQPTPF